MNYRIQVNGEARTVEAEPDTPLLWVLRDDLELTGTKFGCGRALCGACTVHLDGQAVRSCSYPISLVGERSVRTIETLESDRVGKAVVDAWINEDVVQCGWCQPGQCMSAAALLTGNSTPNDKDIDGAMSGNLCRCGTYPRVRKAIKVAAENLRKEAK